MSCRETKQKTQAAAPKIVYPPEAFHFVRRGLEFTGRRVHAGQAALTEEQRHITGQQLSLGLRDYAVENYGHLARTVLEKWNIRGTEDFGQIVFSMVESGEMRATPSDSPRDFDSVFGFEEIEAHVSLHRVPSTGFTPAANS